MVPGKERGGFATATLLLVDISKVKLLKGNSTSKTNRKWAFGELTDGSGVCVIVLRACASSENQLSPSGRQWRDRPTRECLHRSHSGSPDTAFSCAGV